MSMQVRAYAWGPLLRVVCKFTRTHCAGIVTVSKVKAIDLPKWEKHIRKIDRAARLARGEMISGSSSRSSHSRVAPARGRKSNASFAFAFGHPLRLSHKQQLRSKHFIPVPVPRPPRMPEFDAPPPLPRGVKRDSAKRAAAYYLTLFRPWSSNAPPNTSYAAWADWVQGLQTEGSVQSLFRLSVMTRMSHGFAEAKTTAKLSAAFRLRNVRYWNSRVADGTAPPPGMHAPASRDSEVIGDDDAAAAAAVADLAAMASRPGDASDDGSLRRAQNSAQQVDKVLQGYYSVTSVPGLVPAAALSDASVSVAAQGFEANIRNEWLLVQGDVDVVHAEVPLIVHAAAVPILPEWPDDSMLSPSQLSVARHIRQFLPGQSPNLTPFLVIGGPGTGKTFVAKYLASCCESLGVGARSAALAASAAGLLSKGCTLHTLIGIGGRGKTGKDGARTGEAGIPKDFLKPVSVDKLRKLRLKFRNVRLLIIDEMSMVPVDLLGHVNKRLQVKTCPHAPLQRSHMMSSDSCQLIYENESLFGGLVVVMMGDFDQLPPVTGPSIAEQLMALALSGDVVPVGSAAESAVAAFQSARTFFLTEQKRCSDSEWLNVLDACRANGNLTPISGKIKPLTYADCERDPLWRSATVATFGNRVRQVHLILPAVDCLSHKSYTHAHH